MYCIYIFRNFFCSDCDRTFFERYELNYHRKHSKCGNNNNNKINNNNNNDQDQKQQQFSETQTSQTSNSTA